MKVQIITVPYDSGHRGLRAGQGPEHFIQQGLAGRLRARGHDVSVDTIEASTGFRTEITTSFELYRLLSERVRVSHNMGSFPLVLAGNCASSLGTVAGVGAASTGVVWFDAHGDFNTPDSTVSGMLDGMALAALSGRCWKSLAATIPGFSPVPESHIAHIGARALDTQEEVLLNDSCIAVLGVDRVNEEHITATLADLSQHVRQIYVHIDLDVLDPGEATANEFAAPNGLAVEQVAEAVRQIGKHSPIAACAITAYDPSYDVDDQTLNAGFKLAEAVVEAVSA